MRIDSVIKKIKEEGVHLRRNQDSRSRLVYDIEEFKDVMKQRKGYIERHINIFGYGSNTVMLSFGGIKESCGLIEYAYKQ
jgi:hypothetical protein